jgi:glycine dehydrogenase subunit 1
LGADGLRRVAASAHANTENLSVLTSTIAGVKRLFNSAFFHEIVLQLDKPAEEILVKMAAQGVQGGYNLSGHFPHLGNAILVCATETKTDADLQRYAGCLREALNPS